MNRQDQAILNEYTRAIEDKDYELAFRIRRANPDLFHGQVFDEPSEASN